MKIGSQLFTAEGPEALRQISKLAPGIFLDLKFCDIPNTVAGAVRAAAKLPGVRMMTLHTTGGLAMLNAAKAALKGLEDPPLLLGVTILTSLDEAELARIGLAGPISDRVAALASMAKLAGMDGIVSAATEVRQLRESLGKDPVLVVPGIRPARKDEKAASHPSQSRDDQVQIATPANAILWGADYLVVGRPITAAPDPVAAFDTIVQEMDSATPARQAQATP